MVGARECLGAVVGLLVLEVDDDRLLVVVVVLAIYLVASPAAGALLMMVVGLCGRHDFVEGVLCRGSLLVVCRRSHSRLMALSPSTHQAPCQLYLRRVQVVMHVAFRDLFAEHQAHGYPRISVDLPVWQGEGLF